MHDSVEKYLNAADGAAKVLAHARLIMRLRGAYEAFAPTYLGQASSVANIKQGIVVIHADNGAVAAKLRQMAQSLAREFLKLGFECSGVEIKVQGRPRPAAPSGPISRPLSRRSSAELSELAASLPANSPLKAGLEHFLRRIAIKEE
ncbi:MAG: DUF721 domain-containing protein [Betaproteobacteria bacterium]|nr:DUF721 domain-containing protein [Betaproteobacteria bacterium]